MWSIFSVMSSIMPEAAKLWAWRMAFLMAKASEEPWALMTGLELSLIHILGNINLDAIEEFQRVNERYTYLTDQRDDVLKSKTVSYTHLAVYKRQAASHTRRNPWNQSS